MLITIKIAWHEITITCFTYRGLIIFLKVSLLSVKELALLCTFTYIVGKLRPYGSTRFYLSAAVKLRCNLDKFQWRFLLFMLKFRITRKWIGKVKLFYTINQRQRNDIKPIDASRNSAKISAATDDKWLKYDTPRTPSLWQMR